MQERYADGLHIDSDAIDAITKTPKGASPHTQAIAGVGRSLERVYGPLPPWYAELTTEVVEYASEVASRVYDGGGDTVLDIHLLFNLARRLQSRFDGHLRRSRKLRDILTPYAVVFTHCLRILEVVPLFGGDRIDWHDDEEVELFWRQTWEKVEYAEGETLLQRTAELAEQCPLEFEAPVRGDAYKLFLAFAYHLQVEQGEDTDILLPEHLVGEYLARSHTTVNNLISTAIEDGYLQCVDPSYRRGKAKRYRFNLRHNNIKKTPVTRA